MIRHATARERVSRADESGSLILAFLAAIVIGSIVAVLLSATVMGQRTVRFDRNFNESVFAADAGVQQAVTVLNRFEDAASTDPQGVLDPIGTEITGDGTAPNAFYRWRAMKTGAREWEMWSQGCRSAQAGVTTFEECQQSGGVVRTLEVEAERLSLFRLAAFGSAKAVLRGGNDVSSYDPEEGDSNDEGKIGTDNELSMHGNTEADGIELWGPNARCSGQGCPDPGDDSVEGFPHPRNLPTAFIEDIIDQCKENDTYVDAWITPTHGTVVTRTVNNTSTQVRVMSYDDLKGTDPAKPPFCFRDVTMTRGDPNNQIHDLHVDPGDPGGEAVVLYMDGTFTVGNGMRINCPEWNGTTCGTPPASNFQIYSIGSKVSLGNHVHVVGAIYAPNASCEGSPSNAQATIYGSIVCGDMGNQGGWNFRYDESLASLGQGLFHIVSWREEVGATSSFDWLN